MNKGVVLGVSIVLIALVAFLYVRARYSSPAGQSVRVPSIQPTQTPGDIGTALRGPTTIPVISGGPTGTPYPTAGTSIITYISPTPRSPTPTSTPIYSTPPTPLPTSTRSPTPTPTRVPLPTQPADPSLVNYTDGGFTPSSTTIKAGTWVTFRNYTVGGMKVVGNAATVATYPNFGAQVAVGQYGLYQFKFTVTGAYTYYNQINPSQTGTVIVVQ